MKWTWVASSGLCITNGEVEASQSQTSNTESDSMTATMFSLDNLNDIKPEVRQGYTWEKSQIPESPDSFVESLVQRVNKKKKKINCFFFFFFSFIIKFLKIFFKSMLLRHPLIFPLFYFITNWFVS